MLQNESRKRHETFQFYVCHRKHSMSINKTLLCRVHSLSVKLIEVDLHLKPNVPNIAAVVVCWLPSRGQCWSGGGLQTLTEVSQQATRGWTVRIPRSHSLRNPPTVEMMLLFIPEDHEWEWSLEWGRVGTGGGGGGCQTPKQPQFVHLMSPPLLLTAQLSAAHARVCVCVHPVWVSAHSRFTSAQGLLW